MLGQISQFVLRSYLWDLWVELHRDVFYAWRENGRSVSWSRNEQKRGSFVSYLRDTVLPDRTKRRNAALVRNNMPLASPLAHGPYFSALTSICHSLGKASYVGDAILYYSCTISAAMSLTLLILAFMLWTIRDNLYDHLMEMEVLKDL